MKINIYILSIFFSVNIFSQETFVLTFFDIDTKLPIENAVVLVNRTKENHLSNEEGKVSFSLSGVSTIEVSHISYKKLTFRSSNFDKKSIAFYLEPQVKNIQEIIITQRHPQLILKDIVENSRKRISIPANLKVYTREFDKIDDKYIYFNDGLLNFQLYYDKNKTLKTDILIEQTRSVGLIDPLDKEVLGYDLVHLMSSYSEFNYLDFIVSKVGISFFDYTLKTHPNNDQLLVMVVEPKDYKGGLLYNYEITYHQKDKIILEIDIFHSEKRLNLLKVVKDQRGRILVENKIKNKYFYKNNDYYLLQSIELIKFKNFKNKKEQIIDVRNVMHVLNFTNKLFIYDEKYLLKQKSLINNKSHLHTPFWEDKSGTLLTQEEEEIIKMINDTPELYYNIYKP
jgi:hypothetical protein